MVAMPDEIYYSSQLDDAAMEQWSRQVCAALETHRNVAIAALQSAGETSLTGSQVTQALAAVARQVVEDDCADDLMIEGGATAYALTNALNIHSLFPVAVLAPGVTRMKVDHYPKLHVTMKPGSYRWPTSIWNFNKKRVK